MAKLGPDLFEQLNVGRGRVLRYREPVNWGKAGLSSRELKAIEEQLGFRLPEDFKYLFGNLRDPRGDLFPWSTFQRKDYEASIDWIWQGIAFDIEHDVWLDRWGSRPEILDEALDVARTDFRTWPKLLPILGHRYLAAEPCRSGNPVFSIKQLDVIYYGADLAHYLTVEFLGGDWKTHTHDQNIRRVDVWSDIAEGKINPYARGRP